MDFASNYNKLRDELSERLGVLAASLADSHILAPVCDYALLPAGKCYRGILCLATAELLGLSRELLVDYALALEIIHSFTLVHDDLPAMDDDKLRRNRPCCHIQYGEASAILAGDFLQGYAYSLVAKAERVPAEIRVRLLSTLAEATLNVCDGQILDLLAAKKLSAVPYQTAAMPLIQDPLAELAERNLRKTVALIKSAVLAPCLFLPPRDEAQAREVLEPFSQHLGLLFQMADDILEASAADSSQLGKDIDSDKRGETPTYVTVLGLKQARALAAQTARQAREVLAVYDQRADFLRWFVDFTLERES